MDSGNDQLSSMDAMRSERAIPSIREATTADVDGILAIYTPIVVGTASSFEEEVPTTADMVARIDHSHVWLVSVEAETVLGYAYAAAFHPRSAYRWSTEVSIYLHATARGRGLGRALLTRLLEELTSIGFVNAFAGITLPNEASVRLFESFGFDKIAHQRNVGFKLGAWHDVGWWQLQLRDPSNPPPEIGPLLEGQEQ